MTVWWTSVVLTTLAAITGCPIALAQGVAPATPQSAQQPQSQPDLPGAGIAAASTVTAAMPGAIPAHSSPATGPSGQSASPPGGVTHGAPPGPQTTDGILDGPWFAAGGDAVSPSPAPQPRQRVPLEASWDYGLRFESPDGRVNLHLGGLAQIDSAWLIGPHSEFAAPGGASNGVGNAQATFIRRAVLAMDGDIFDQFDYSIAFDFANASNDNSGEEPPSFGNLTSSPAPLDIWLQVRDVPYLGNVRIGNQDKPIGMINNTSAAFLPFMERPDNQDAFYGPFDNGFALGIAIHDWTESERVTWRYGIFQPATNVFAVALNKYTLGARVTALPWYEDEGQRLIHLGLGYWGGEIVENVLRDRARPLLRNAPGFAVPVLVDTGQIPGSKQYTIAPEFAMVLGPVTIQAEYAGQFLTHAIAPDGVDQGTVFYHGGYVEALCFLTGEHQDYVRRDGIFGRVVPEHDLHWKKGDPYRTCGAWQVGARFSYLNLNDKAIQGGQLYDWTLGVNWYWNPNMKVQCNYIVEHRDMPGVPPGWINGFGLRAAYDF
jgi:phosphate-selective porin OprO/OprP